MDPEIEAVARRYGLSAAAAETLFDALVAGGGGQAQFSHPELGGMGQWSGGMTQIGAMSDDALKAKVGGFCREVAPAAVRAASRRHRTAQDFDRSPQVPSASATWWPASLGDPLSAGAQDGSRYACFPDRRRLAVEQSGRVTVYDTGSYRLTSFSQQQGDVWSLVFSGPDGTVSLDELTVVAS